MEHTTKYSILNRFKNSIFSNENFYKNIINEPFWKSFVYIICLTMSFSLLVSIFHSNTISKTLDSWIISLNNPTYPEFTIANGELSANIDSPKIYENITLKEFGINDLHLIIDMDNSYSLNNIAGFENAILINQNRLIFSKAVLSPQTIEFSDIDFVFTNNDLLRVLSTIRAYIYLIIIGIGLVLSYLTLIFRVLFVSVLSLIIKNSYNKSLSYLSLLKIIFHSFTLPMVLLSIVNLSPYGPSLNYKQFVFFLLSGVYVIKALRANKTENLTED